MSPMIRRIGSGSFLIERRRRDDLLALREDRLLVDVDDFEVVPPLEILVADRPQVPDGARRSGVMPVTYSRRT